MWVAPDVGIMRKYNIIRTDIDDYTMTITCGSLIVRREIRLYLMPLGKNGKKKIVGVVVAASSSSDRGAMMFHFFRLMV